MTNVGHATGDPTQRYLDFPGGNVHLLQKGQGEPLLFLHAAGGAGLWHEFLELLAQHFEVYAPDHPGFGGSDELADVEDMSDLVFHYRDVIERLGLDRPHVVGASFGGWIAAELAVAAPHSVRTLALLSAAGLRVPDHPVADLFLMTPGQLATALFHDPAKAASMVPAEPDVDTALAAYRDQTALARFGWAPFLSNPKLARRLHRIDAPTLVVWPADDRLIPLAHGHRYAELIPHAQFQVVDNCGHAMYLERPAAFAQVTIDFLATSQHSGGHR